MKLASFIGRLYATVLGAAIQGPTALGWARIAIDANLCRLYAATREVLSAKPSISSVRQQLAEGSRWTHE